MFLKLERRDPLPTIDPYRQLIEYDVKLDGYIVHDFLGSTTVGEYRPVYKVVPIDSPERFFMGLKKLVQCAQSKATEVNSLNPSPYDSVRGIIHLNKEEYLEGLKEVTGTFLGIHGTLMESFTKEQQEHLEAVLNESKNYEQEDWVERDPNWRPGINHTTGLPYNFFNE